MRRDFTSGVHAVTMPVPTRGDIARMYDTIAPEYDRTRREPWPEAVEFAESLPPRTLVADLGCGSGRHAKVLAGMGHRVVGLDASARLLSIAHKALPNAQYLRGDLCALPFHDARFPAAIAVATVHHLPSGPERLTAMREIARVLRPAGRALVTVWAFEQGPGERRRDAHPVGRDPHDVWVPWRAGKLEVLRFYHLFADGELSDLVEAAGLRAAKYFRSADNYVAVAERHG